MYDVTLSRPSRALDRKGYAPHFKGGSLKPDRLGAGGGNRAIDLGTPGLNREIEGLSINLSSSGEEEVPVISCDLEMFLCTSLST